MFGQDLIYFLNRGNVVLNKNISKCACAEKQKTCENHKIMRRDLNVFNLSATFLDAVSRVRHEARATTHIYIKKQWEIKKRERNSYIVFDISYVGLLNVF